MPSLFFESYEAAEKFIRFSKEQKESFYRFFKTTDQSTKRHSDGSPPTKKIRVNPTTQLVDGINFSELFNHLFNTILQANKNKRLESFFAHQFLARIAINLISELETKLQIKDMSGLSIIFNAGSH